MGDIEFIKLVKSRVLDDFEVECLQVVTDQQEQGRVVEVNYKPIVSMASVGSVHKPDLIHSAMIIARRSH